MDKIIFVGLFFFLNPVIATEIKSGGKIEFEAVGRPSMLIITGVGEEVHSNLKIADSKLSGEVRFKLESLKTGIIERDKEMKEKYLEIGSYPFAKITFDQFQMPAGWSAKNPKVVNSSFRGKLNLHGVEREVTGFYTISPDLTNSTANFEIKLSDYKIKPPVYLGIKVADFVKIKVSLGNIAVTE